MSEGIVKSRPQTYGGGISPEDKTNIGAGCAVSRPPLLDKSFCEVDSNNAGVQMIDATERTIVAYEEWDKLVLKDWSKYYLWPKGIPWEAVMASLRDLVRKEVYFAGNAGMLFSILTEVYDWPVIKDLFPLTPEELVRHMKWLRDESDLFWHPDITFCDWRECTQEERDREYLPDWRVIGWSESTPILVTRNEVEVELCDVEDVS